MRVMDEAEMITPGHLQAAGPLFLHPEILVVSTAGLGGSHEAQRKRFPASAWLGMPASGLWELVALLVPLPWGCHGILYLLLSWRQEEVRSGGCCQGCQDVPQAPHKAVRGLNDLWFPVLFGLTYWFHDTH